MLTGFVWSGASRANEATEAKSFFQINQEVRTKHGWLLVHGTVSAVDPAGKTITLQGRQRKEVFNITDETRGWNRGRTASLKAARPGEYIDAVIKVNADHSVAMIAFSLGKPADYLPYGIKNSPDNRWIKSPYATNETAFDMKYVVHGDVIQCPYTGRFFIRP